MYLFFGAEHILYMMECYLHVAGLWWAVLQPDTQLELDD